MKKNVKIYIAGHRGLVGSGIVRKLKEAGYENLLLCTSAELDLRNQADVEAFFEAEKPEYVILAAAKVGGILANDTYPADFIRDNLQIQTNTIDAAYRNGVKKLLFLGSSCIYPKEAPQPMTEDCLLTGPLEPTNRPYALAKIAGIEMCQAYRRQYGFNAISLMPTNLYGPNDNFDLNNSHVLPALIRKFHLAKLALAGNVDAITADEQCYGKIPDDILSGLGLTREAGCISHLTSHIAPKVTLWGSGTPRREFLYVDDLADACLFLMKSYEGEGVVNVGVGEDVSIKDLAALVRGVVGFEGDIIWDASKPDGTLRKLLDVSRLHDLGWQSRTALVEGVTNAYQCYCKSAHSAFE